MHKRGEVIFEAVAFEAQVILISMEENPNDKIHPIDFAALANLDTMYLNQVLITTEKFKFIKAMTNEINGHKQRGHRVVVTHQRLPKGIPISFVIWPMTQKCILFTKEVYKWKARLTMVDNKHKDLATWAHIHQLCDGMQNDFL